MGEKVIMPQIGESVVEGTVTKWLKAEGDQIDELEPLLEINTDKVDTELPSPAKGTLLKIYVQEGETVRAGSLLAFIGEPGEALPHVPERAVEGAAVASEPAPSPAPQPVAAAPPAPREGDLGFISPVVARIASEHDVDLRQVRGTGRGGRITKKDILAHIESRSAAPAKQPWEEPASGELFRPSEEVFARPAAKAEQTAMQPGQVVPIDAVRRSIAEHMVRSKHTSPHVTTVMEVNLRRVVAHRQAHKAQYAAEGVALTFSAYFALAAVEALRAMPMVNSSWSEEGILLHKQVNLGIAVSLGERGLIVPVIKDADNMSLLGLAKAIQDLAGRARARQLKPDEVRGGTFTITNHGVSGSLFATPIINQPQAAILGVGAIQKRVVVVELPTPEGDTLDALAIQPMVYLTLTFDHRILDGAIADEFLAHVVRRLESWA